METPASSFTLAPGSVLPAVSFEIAFLWEVSTGSFSVVSLSSWFSAASASAVSCASFRVCFYVYCVI